MATSFTIQGIEKEDRAAFSEWAGRYGMSDGAFFRYLAKAYKDGLVFILPRESAHLLFDAYEERILKTATRAARKATKSVLWEEGFVPTPE